MPQSLISMCSVEMLAGPPAFIERGTCFTVRSFPIPFPSTFTAICAPYELVEHGFCTHSLTVSPTLSLVSGRRMLRKVCAAAHDHLIPHLLASGEIKLITEIIRIINFR